MPENPHQDVEPITLPDGTRAWLVTGYEAARQALADPRLSKQVKAEELGLPPEPANAMLSMMMFRDPPDHTRLRRMISAAFTTRRIESMRPRIEQIADDLLDAIATRETVDLVETFARPLPLHVICELLGLPAEDRAEFREYSAVVAAGQARQHEMPAAMTAVIARIRAMLADRARHPGDDLLTALIAVHEQGDRLSTDELTSMVAMLLIAGHETTVHLIATGTFLLLDDRSRWHRLRADPTLLPTAIEEFIRYETPVANATHRTTTTTVTLAGHTIPPGSRVVVKLAAANRDKSRFPDPDTLHLDRPHNPHLGFGHGPHYCLGAPLARLQAQTAFTALMTRFPHLTLATPSTQIPWRSDFQRGVTHLPVHLHGPR